MADQTADDAITDEMIEAGTDAVQATRKGCCQGDMGWMCARHWGAHDYVEDIIAAALAAAPTVDVAFITTRNAEYEDVTVHACWAVKNLKPHDDNPWVVTTPDECKALDCPGPHRTLIVGPRTDA